MLINQPSQTIQEERPIEPSPHIKAKVDAINEKKLEFIKSKSEVKRVILQPTTGNTADRIFVSDKC